MCCGGLDLAEPVEGIVGDLGKAPARQVAGVGRAFLHDVLAMRAADLLTEHATRRIGQQFEIDRRGERSFRISRDTLPTTPTVIILDGV